MNAHTFPLLRLLADGHFHSGEALGRSLGLTRAAIWNAVKHAEVLGVEIFSVRGKGYKLAQPVDFLDQKTIAQLAGNDFAIEVLSSSPSTNTHLMQRAAQGAPGGTCVATELQTAGRGRRGRIWVSGLGNGLTFSLLWRFGMGAGSLGGLSLAAGVALARALEELGFGGIQLKWPNDLLFEGRKLAGILIELQGEMQGPTTAVIGIGLNLRLPQAARNGIDQPVADLAEIGALPSRSVILASLLRHLGQVFRQFGQEGFLPLREEWQSRHAFHGQAVKLLLPDGSAKSALINGVAEDGTLLADAGQGNQRFSSAEISLRGQE
jgi:BirA family biotin operon repressor/biotin-[acetyl-CoA-carboxylase] ligase